MESDNLIFFNDTETTGLPDWKTPSGGDSQPHIVQIAAILAHNETGDVQSVFEAIIRPDGWEIPPEMTEIHGISQEMALDVGVDEKTAVQTFLEMRADWPRVAHNRTFDQRIIRIALKRYFSEADQEKWATKDDYFCTMNVSKRYGSPTAKLSDAYAHFMGATLEDAHSALADAKACMDVFFAMRELGETYAVID